ncbi:hypothetical protein [Baekduia sp.]|uniref:hypothetical protein n=1 Tax=Baekduia sp. TaxID=2600305 RepID=UPI002E0591B1|nr:hypothetical protein [Baekduia sp.]
MPALRRRRGGGDEGVAPAVPWALGELLRVGPAPLADRPLGAGDGLDVALVLGPGQVEAREAGVPAELLQALKGEGVVVQVVADGDDPARADVVLAAGWPAAPAVLRAAGVRARAVLATSAPAPLVGLGWTAGIEVLGPPWLDGSLPGGADAAYTPLPVHRREDLVLVHGDEPFGLLAAAELRRRRDDLTFAVSGVRQDLELPFPFLGVEPGGDALAHAFASATVALAPPVRGWRPAAVAMLVCGQTIVAPDDAPTRVALGATASFASGPLAAANEVEALLADLPLRAERARAGFAHIASGWSATATALATALRELP